MLGTWLSTPALAYVAGISRQSAHEALARAIVGGSWRGATLVVRDQRGRGGRAGRQYEVRADSLPLDLQELLKRERLVARGPLHQGERQAVEREWRFGLIRPALEHPRYSRERGAILNAIVATPQRHPIKGMVQASMVSLQRWLREYEACGLGGLQMRARSDAGRERVLVSATWDRRVSFDHATKLRMRERVRQDLRDLWGNGAVYSVVRRLASEGLALQTRALGFDPGPEELARICLLPKSIVEKERRAREVHQFQDREARHERDDALHDIA